MAVPSSVVRLCREDLDDRDLRTALVGELRGRIPFDAYAWILTDPETCVGSSPLAELPTLDAVSDTVRLKYLTSVNRWTALGAGEAVSLKMATGGQLDRSRLWAEALVEHGVEDVVSTVFRDVHGCWAFLDLWRMTGAFAPREVQLLAEVSEAVTPALRRSLRSTFEPPCEPRRSQREGPSVVILDDALDIVSRTPQVDHDLRSLLPTDSGADPVPAAVLNVAAQLLAVEAGVDAHPARARAFFGGGRWVTLAAARADDAGTRGGAVVVTIETTDPTERLRLYARVLGLTARETEVLQGVAAGRDTRALSRDLHLSAHTVQDHLKSVFAKAGAGSRKVVVARSTGIPPQ